MPITNERLVKHTFLLAMHADAYFPKDLVDKGARILVNLCEEIEAKRPASLANLYELSHAAAERFNELGAEFEQHGSELETAAREAIAEEFRTIADAYGFENADTEELIAPREW